MGTRSGDSGCHTSVKFGRVVTTEPGTCALTNVQDYLPCMIK